MKIVANKINNNFLFEGKNSSGHKVLLDNKSKKEGEIAGISPMELLLMGLAGCSGIDIITILDKQKLKLNKLKIEVEGFRKKNQFPSPFKKINVKIEAEGNIDEKKIIRAVQLSFDKYCSVSKTLEHTAQIKYEIIMNTKKIL